MEDIVPLADEILSLPLELRPDLSRGMAGTVEAEEGIGGAVFEEDTGDIVAEGRRELEAVAGAAAEEPDVAGLRMTAEEEVAVRAVLVLADAGLDDAARSPGGGSGGPGSPAPPSGGRRDEPLAEGGIERGAPGVVRHLEAAVLVARHAVDRSAPC